MTYVSSSKSVHSSYISSVTFSSDDQYIASGSHDKKVTVWRLEDLRQPDHIFESEDQVNSVAFTPSGNYVAGAT